VSDIRERPAYARPLVAAACFVVVVFGLREAQSILVPLLLAAFIAMIATPAMFWLTRRGLPTPLALCVMILALLAVTVAGLGMIGKSLSDLSSNLGTLQESFQSQLAALLAWLRARGIKVPESFVYDFIEPLTSAGFLTNLLSGVTNLLSQAFLILLYVIFMLLEAAIIPEKIRRLPGLSEEQWDEVRQVVNHVRHYMGMKTLMSLLTGALVTVVLWLLGVPYALLMGLLAFLLNYVPNIGSLIAAVPGVLLALVTGGVTVAVAAAAGYAVINMAVGNFLEPRLMGRGLGLSPLVILISLVVWGWVFGPVGMLLSVPLTVAAKIALEGNTDTRWIAMLLGSGTPLADPSPTVTKAPPAARRPAAGQPQPPATAGPPVKPA
jgi:AI-2 transport protein TqsA